MSPSIEDSTLLIVTGDQHINSTIGLCPRAVELDDGGVYNASKAQRWIWRKWTDYWQWTDGLKTEYKPTRALGLFLGDVVDLNKHSKHQLITQNSKTILSTAEIALRPAYDVIDDAIFVRGTEAHVGGSGELEEKLADDLGAIKDPERGTSSWWYFDGELSGIRVDAAHHPQTAGWMPHTERSAAMRQSAILLARYAQQGEKPPHLAFFAHVHYFADSGIGSMPRVFFNWSWQLTTAFGHRLGGGGPSVRPIGGMAVFCKNGEYEILGPKQYRAPRRKRWTP